MTEMLEQKQFAENKQSSAGAGLFLMVIVLIGLAIRVDIAVRVGMISRDGATFIWYARALGEHPLTALRGHDQHPLYPAMILATHGLLGPVRALFPQSVLLNDAVIGWQTAAMLATLLSGLAVVVVMYFVAKELFGRGVGLWAAGLTALAAEFCQLSADALSDMTHLAPFLFSLAVVVRGMRSGSLWTLAGGGALSGLAFLCRPEGAEVAAAACVVAMTMRGWNWRDRLAIAAAVGVGAAAVASPYMIVTGWLDPQETGERICEPSPKASGINFRGRANSGRST